MFPSLNLETWAALSPPTYRRTVTVMGHNHDLTPPPTTTKCTALKSFLEQGFSCHAHNWLFSSSVRKDQYFVNLHSLKFHEWSVMQIQPLCKYCYTDEAKSKCAKEWQEKPINHITKPFAQGIYTGVLVSLSGYGTRSIANVTSRQMRYSFWHEYNLFLIHTKPPAPRMQAWISTKMPGQMTPKSFVKVPTVGSLLRQPTQCTSVGKNVAAADCSPLLFSALSPFAERSAMITVKFRV